MMFKYIRDETRSPPEINSGHGSPAILRDRQWERRSEIPPSDPIGCYAMTTAKTQTERNETNSLEMSPLITQLAYSMTKYQKYPYTN